MFVILGGIVFVMLVFAVWRISSYRWVIPCPTWLSWLVEVDNPFLRISKAETIIEHAGIVRGMTVLDAGCGPGRVTVPAAQAVGLQGKVVAVDIQEGMIEKARTKVYAAGIVNVGFVVGAIGEGTLQWSHAFDRVLLVTVLGEIPHQRAALQEIFLMLKPGGILSITEIIFDPHFQRLGSVRELARVIGFREVAWFGSRIAYTVNFERPNSEK